MDSSGLSVLVSVFKAARAPERRRGLAAFESHRALLIELTRLQQVFPIFDDEAAALARLR